MAIATIAATIILALAFGAAGGGKLTGAAPMVEGLRHVGAERLRPLIGALEVAGAAGVIVGLWVPWLGVVAALGLAAIGFGAIVFHLRVGDGPDRWGPPGGLGVLAVVVALLQAG